MKTFKQLSVGDTIYRLCDKYDLGKTDKEQVSKIIIKDLSIDDATGNLLINKITTYTRETYWSIIINVDKLSKTWYTFNPQQNTHRSGFYFINESDANYVVRRAVLKKIKSIQISIPATVKRYEAEIIELRSTFHEILNPSFYPKYKVI